MLAERVLREADALGLGGLWAQPFLGNPSLRCTAYRPEQRIAAVLSDLAAGLKGIAPGNSTLRPNTAFQARLGGRFPDQGTIHRWLDQVSASAGRGSARPPPSGRPPARSLPGGLVRPTLLGWWTSMVKDCQRSLVSLVAATNDTRDNTAGNLHVF